MDSTEDWYQGFQKALQDVKDKIIVFNSIPLVLPLVPHRVWRFGERKIDPAYIHCFLNCRWKPHIKTMANPMELFPQVFPFIKGMMEKINLPIKSDHIELAKLSFINYTLENKIQMVSDDYEKIKPEYKREELRFIPVVKIGERKLAFIRMPAGNQSVKAFPSVKTSARDQ